MLKEASDIFFRHASVSKTWAFRNARVRFKKTRVFAHLRDSRWAKRTCNILVPLKSAKLRCAGPEFPSCSAGSRAVHDRLSRTFLFHLLQTWRCSYSPSHHSHAGHQSYEGRWRGGPLLVIQLLLSRAHSPLGTQKKGAWNFSQQ